MNVRQEQRSIQETVNLLMNGSRRVRKSTANVERKREHQAIYYNQHEFELSRDLMVRMSRLLIIKIHDDHDNFYLVKNRSKMFGVSKDWWCSNKRSNFAKARMKNIVNVLRVLGGSDVSLNVGFRGGAIKLSEVVSTFNNYKFNKYDRAKLRNQLGTLHNLKRISFKKCFGETPLITLMMFLDIMGYSKLIIDIKKSYKMYKELGCYKECKNE